MARTTLGKRTRSAASSERVEQPVKRSKRLAAISIVAEDDNNEENWTPDETHFSDDDEPEPIPHKTPKKLRRVPSLTSLKSPYPVTPSTPRHRDVFAANPTTPRHIVMSAGKLFKRLTPSTPLSPAAVPTVYNSGRQLFARGADPGELVGRTNEREQLDTFLARLSTKTPGGCLYVSGPPGTGKSAMVQRRTEEAAAREGVRHVYVNCMSIKSSKGLYDTILQAISPDQDEATGADTMTTLQTMFLGKKGSEPYLVVLDEIDHILTLNLESMYKVFEWSLQKSSRLTLVGIANALDLTDRHLPRLKAKNLKPELLPFMPYSSGQIKDIITTRLRKLLSEGTDAKPEFVPLIHPAAIDLCARKVSNQTGDLRRVFEVCRRALDLIEAETRQKHEDEARETLLQMTPSRKPLGENVNLTTSPGRKASSSRSVPQMVAKSLKALTAENAPRASIGHLNKVTAAAFSNGTNQRLKALNLQQKAALCSLIAKEKHTRAAAAMPAKTSTIVSTPSSKAIRGISAPTVRMLFEAYAALCTKDSVLHPLSASEFREVVGSLEALGLVQEVDGRTGSLVVRGGGVQTTPGGRKKGGFPAGDARRVASCVAEKEMEEVVCGGVGEGILKSILSGDALD